MTKVSRPIKEHLTPSSWKTWISSNGIPIEEGQIVLYSNGTSIEKCVVRKIGQTSPYMRPSKPGTFNPYYAIRGNIHIEILDVGPYRKSGHIYKAKAACRLWVLDQTLDEALEELING